MENIPQQRICERTKTSIVLKTGDRENQEICQSDGLNEKKYTENERSGTKETGETRS